MSIGHGVSFRDVDNDGDEDIYMVVGGAYSGDISQNCLFKNPGTSNNWLNLKLEGSTSNKSAIGARVKIALVDQDGSPKFLHRTVDTGGSFGSNSLELEIGLGALSSIDYVEVKWPNAAQSKSIYKKLQANKAYLLKENQDKPRERKFEKIAL